MFNIRELPKKKRICYQHNTPKFNRWLTWDFCWLQTFRGPANMPQLEIWSLPLTDSSSLKKKSRSFLEKGFNYKLYNCVFLRKMSESSSLVLWQETHLFCGDLSIWKHRPIFTEENQSLCEWTKIQVQHAATLIFGLIDNSNSLPTLWFERFFGVLWLLSMKIHHPWLIAPPISKEQHLPDSTHDHSHTQLLGLEARQTWNNFIGDASTSQTSPFLTDRRSLGSLWLFVVGSPIDWICKS